ncbi:hypothetical protein HQQ80_14445 [Microbacteriaceae bacterium VKM Ac-2855]|nr:hypothetical protein [Microbacteriaceae bacterium VKM Ac-2855]
MQATWDESYFDAQQGEDTPVYWVCFWTGDDVERPATHDPQRITGAASVADVLDWLREEKGDRRFELFVETLDHAESRETGWTARRKLIRLAGDFRPGGTSETVIFTALR